MTKQILAVLLLALAPCAGAAETAWKFAVLSDVHNGTWKTPGGATGVFLHKAAERLAAEKPDLVVITGDFTRGNPDDKYPVEQVRAWWANVEAALKPLEDAGIPVVPVPGNHDQYTPAHRQAYAEAWRHFAVALASFSVQGEPPRYYSFTHKGVHFSQLTLPDSYLPDDEAAWLKKDLADAGGAALRFVFGHVPMDSALGKPVLSFRKKLGGILAAGRASAYVCGHEHLNWDSEADTGSGKVRQVIVGSGMDDPYNYPIRRALYARYCRACDGECMMPFTGRHFPTDPATHLQRARQTLYIFTVDPALKDGYSATPYTLDKAGALAPFYGEGSGRPAPCPRPAAAGK